MLVAELQNQDPTNPVTNSELMQEVSQIRSIQATDGLNSTLQSVLLGQSVATAGNDVSGNVSSVSISGGNATLNVGNSTLPLSNVTQVSAAGQ
jgi:flagellar basal-body rod modification protein FlgD